MSVLFTQQQIVNAEKATADWIEKKATKDILLVPILDGALPFFSGICRQLNRKGIDYNYESMCVQSYGSGCESSEIKLVKDIGFSKDCSIFIIDDIFDTGKTAEFVSNRLQELDVSFCFLVSKKFNSNEFTINGYSCFCPFPIYKPDVWLYGYGMDIEYKKRGLKEIWGKRNHSSGHNQRCFS